MGEYDSLFGKPLRLFFYDIETAPMLSFHWQAKTEYVGTHLNEVDDRQLLCWAGKWSDSDQVVSARVTQKEAKAQDDARIVGLLADEMRAADYVVAHNGDKFDYRRVNARVLVNTLKPLGSVQMIDTLKLSRQSFDLPYHNLDYLAQTLGFGEKLHTNFELWRRAFYGEVTALKEMEAYNRQDVVLLEHVFHAMRPYVKKLPRLIDATEWRDELCPNCGYKDRKKAGYHRTSVNTFQKYRCLNCEREFKGWQAIGSQKMGATPV